MSFFALVRLSMSTTRISSRVLEVSYIARDRSATQSISQHGAGLMEIQAVSSTIACEN